MPRRRVVATKRRGRYMGPQTRRGYFMSNKG